MDILHHAYALHDIWNDEDIPSKEEFYVINNCHPYHKHQMTSQRWH
jgi:hypothetical protein